MAPPAAALSPARPSPQADDPHQLWQRVLALLQPRIGQAQFDTYLRGTLGLAYDPGASALRVAAANPFHVPWLEGKLSSVIHTAVAELLGGPIRVEFVASPTPTNGHAKPRP